MSRLRDGDGRRERLAAARLYLCTPIRADLAAFADAVLEAGVDLIQLRDKRAEAGQLLEAAAVLRAAADRHGALFAVNDRADVALAAGADVLHLGQDDLPMAWARRILGHDVLLGRSTHDLDQATLAAAEPWDYLAVGPVWPTATKPGRPATGTTLVQAVADLGPPQPWFAIGGIDIGNLDQVTAAGATRVVVVRAITEAPDPATATSDLCRRLSSLSAPGSARQGVGEGPAGPRRAAG
ncbi:MAG TPA: thiamine phosphate synthase [Actinomycetes bacterium]|nr:thiamine phosphate synthase [Actinomycetes bacterium]